MDLLVGNTGFVGSNILQSHAFDTAYHSSDIESAYGLQPDLCVYAGVRAEKYLAQHDPEADRKVINSAIENIQKIQPRRLVLISTIDVYPSPIDVDENSVIVDNSMNVYGTNRRILEKWVQENVADYLIVRLPALFGHNIKKNFIYDLIHIVPSMLKKEKYLELTAQDPEIAGYYSELQNGFYKCTASGEEERLLRPRFEALGFSALNFTDSRAEYQFYDLTCLWKHIDTALVNGLNLVNLAVEPVKAAELYKNLRNTDFENELGDSFPRYDFRTIHAERFGGQNGYIFDKSRVMADIRKRMLDEGALL